MMVFSENSDVAHQPKQETQEYIDGLLIDATRVGKGISQPLMIGSVMVNNDEYSGITFEQTRKELYTLIDKGYIELDPNFRPRLTKKGEEKFGRQGF